MAEVQLDNVTDMNATAVRKSTMQMALDREQLKQRAELCREGDKWVCSATLDHVTIRAAGATRSKAFDELYSIVKMLFKGAD